MTCRSSRLIYQYLNMYTLWLLNHSVVSNTCFEYILKIYRWHNMQWLHSRECIDISKNLPLYSYLVYFIDQYGTAGDISRHIISLTCVVLELHQYCKEDTILVSRHGSYCISNTHRRQVQRVYSWCNAVFVSALWPVLFSSVHITYIVVQGVHNTNRCDWPP